MRRGLTLIELLVVVAILATVAGTVLVSQEGVEDRTRVDLTNHQLVELRAAILRFRRDTGYLPKHGPYDLVSVGGPGEITPTAADGSVLTGAEEDAYRDWFYSPANLIQLYKNPLKEKRKWDPDTKRGWNGPYLVHPLYVTVGTDLDLNGTIGNGRTGSLVRVPSLADSHAHQVSADSYFLWTISPDPPTGEQPLRQKGRPLLFLYSTEVDEDTEARVVSCGRDGAYAPRAANELLPIGFSPPKEIGDVPRVSDDQGLFLFR